MATFQAIPVELHFQVLSYLQPFNPTLKYHPIDTLAATSQHLNRVTEEYTRSLLKTHSNLAPKPTPGLVYRKKWFKWLLTTCQDCKKSSKRKAILEPEKTLCKDCDRKEPKMTMTSAISIHGLSKLDLFTPNTLHPNLPALNVGEYMCMGSTTIMILESDVLQRKAYIHNILNANGKIADAGTLRRRAAAHDRVIEALDIMFKRGQWMRMGRYSPNMEQNGAVRKSWQTQEGRMKYAKEQLQKEWRDMGMLGGSKEDAIQVE